MKPAKEQDAAVVEVTESRTTAPLWIITAYMTRCLPSRAVQWQRKLFFEHDRVQTLSIRQERPCATKSEELKASLCPAQSNQTCQRNVKFEDLDPVSLVLVEIDNVMLNPVKPPGEARPFRARVRSATRAVPRLASALRSGGSPADCVKESGFHQGHPERQAKGLAFNLCLRVSHGKSGLNKPFAWLLCLGVPSRYDPLPPLLARRGWEAR
jgi:hypothetical protein